MVANSTRGKVDRFGNERVDIADFDLALRWADKVYFAVFVSEISCRCVPITESQARILESQDADGGLRFETYISGSNTARFRDNVMLIEPVN